MPVWLACRNVSDPGQRCLEMSCLSLRPVIELHRQCLTFGKFLPEQGQSEKLGNILSPTVTSLRFPSLALASALSMKSTALESEISYKIEGFIWSYWKVYDWKEKGKICFISICRTLFLTSPPFGSAILFSEFLSPLGKPVTWMEVSSFPSSWPLWLHIST